ncbi:hypothetical protein CLOM_g7698 [Closterium sp. NIES-68]|nr:hypothetical protein CLOM_g7698 [Closterium sp. NIES-68]
MADQFQAENEPATAGFVAEWVAKLCLCDASLGDGQCGGSDDDLALASPLRNRTISTLHSAERRSNTSSSKSGSSSVTAADQRTSSSSSAGAAGAVGAAVAAIASADSSANLGPLTPRRLRVAVQPHGSPAAVPLFLPNDFGGDAVWGQSPGFGKAARAAAIPAASPPRHRGSWTDGASCCKTKRRTALGRDDDGVAGVRRALGWDNDEETKSNSSNSSSSNSSSSLGAEGESSDGDSFATRCDLLSSSDESDLLLLRDPFSGLSRQSSFVRDSIPQSPPRFSPPDAGSPRSCASGSVSPMSVLPAPLVLNLSASLVEMAGGVGRDEDALIMLPIAWDEAEAEAEVEAEAEADADADAISATAAEAAAVSAPCPRSAFASPPPRASASPPIPRHAPLPPAWSHAATPSPPARCNPRARNSPPQFPRNHGQTHPMGEAGANSRSPVSSANARNHQRSSAHNLPRPAPHHQPTPLPDRSAPHHPHQQPHPFRAWPASSSALPPIGACARNNFRHPLMPAPMHVPVHMGMAMGMMAVHMPGPNHPPMPMHHPMHMQMPMHMPVPMAMPMPMGMHPLALSSVPVHLPPHLAFPCRPFPGANLAGMPGTGGGAPQNGGKAEKAAGGGGDAGGAASAVAVEGSSGTGVFLPRTGAADSCGVTFGGEVAGWA